MIDIRVLARSGGGILSIASNGYNLGSGGQFSYYFALFRPFSQSNHVLCSTTSLTTDSLGFTSWGE